MVGDSTWDCEAAARAGVASIAVLTGGFSERELYQAGASAVFETLEELAVTAQAATSRHVVANDRLPAT